jgi:CHAD domain-containing protein
MPDGKWIPGLSPDMTLKVAARHVLVTRLDVVNHWLPSAVHEADQDPENVHQLRVATRRADAALRIFRPCLPGKTYRNARARLRTIRRAAGAARDWDVFLIELRQRARSAKDADRPGLDFLAGYAAGQRACAQSSLENVETDLEEPFPDFVTKTLDDLHEAHEDGKTTLIELARSLLSELLIKLHERATGDLKDYERLHKVRIAGKRLRYALEVFADCFGPELRDRLYPMVEEMQEILGRANDSHVASGRLSELRGRIRGWEDVSERLLPGVEGLLRFHQRRLPQERRRFLKWWEQWCAAGVEAVLFAPASAVTSEPPAVV